MKAVVSKASLVAIIGKIQSIVPARPTLPILANVLIEASNDQLVFSATDLMVSMRAFVEAKVIEEGAITLPARLLFQLIRELMNPEVEIHSETTDVAFVNAGSSHFRLQAMPKEEFPLLPDLSTGTPFSFSTALLKEMLTRTAFAAAREDSRQTINGIYMQHANDVTTFTATNGKCIASVNAPLSSVSENVGQTSCILPIKAVEEIIKMLDTKEGQAESQVQLTLMSDKCAVDTGSMVLITKLLSGAYPDVMRVIPEKKNVSVSLHKEELISLLRQVSLFTSEGSNSVRLSFTQGMLHLAAISGNLGEGKVNMPVNYGGAALEIAFNPHHFLDILRHTKGETVNLGLLDSFNPGVVTDDSSAQFVMMPMRLV